MNDPKQIAADLSQDEREAVLSLTGERPQGTILLATARRLRDRGLVVIQPDGHMDPSDVVWRVLDILRAA